MLQVGEAAPDFELPSDDGGRLALSAFAGRPVVVYFYPKDDTEGCRLEAREFSALASAFAEAGSAVIGISPDSPKRHRNFKTKHELALSLVSDEDHAVAERYGVWVEKTMYGRTFMGVERATFLLDAKGRIAHIWRKVSPRGHAAEVLETAQALAQS